MQTYPALSLQSLSASVFCLKKTKEKKPPTQQRNVMPGLFLLFFLIMLFCLLTLAFFETSPPVKKCVLFNWMLHWVLISQEHTLLIWSNFFFFFNYECELERVLTLRHALYHVFISSIKMFVWQKLMVFFPRCCHLVYELCLETVC